MPAAAQTPAQKVAVLPFKINADKDYSFLKNGIVDMLSSRLAWADKVSVIGREATADAIDKFNGDVNEQSAREIGGRLDADWVLYGSLTIFGSSVSIDAKMVDVAGQKETLSFFNQSQSMDEVIPRINAFAEEINERVFDRRTAARPLPPSSARQNQQVPEIYAHPEKLLEGGGFAEDQGQEGGSPFVMGQPLGSEAGFWKSRNFDEEIRGLSLGDVDGDGQIETVLVSSQKIYIYRHAAGRFAKITEIAGERYRSFLSVDTADIHENGKAEIFVNCIDQGTKNLCTFVLEYDGTDFKPVAENLNWYVRAIQDADRGTLLVAQKRGVSDLFLPGLYELTWDGATYAETQSVPAPSSVRVFGFTIGDLLGDHSRDIAYINQLNRLQIFRPDGRKEWESDERYGGSETFLEESFFTSTKHESAQLFYLQPRLFVMDLDQNGKKELLTIQNQSLTGTAFERFRRYTSAQFVSLSWDGLGLAQNWHTRKISGYVSSFSIGDFDNDGKPELTAVVVKDRKTGIAGGKSSIIFYDLDAVIKERPKE